MENWGWGSGNRELGTWFRNKKLETGAKGRGIVLMENTNGVEREGEADGVSFSKCSPRTVGICCS